MVKRFIPPFGNDRIRLRLIEEKDLPMTLAWRNQDHIRKWFIHPDRISMEQHQNWYRQYSQRDDDYLFIIEEIRDMKKPVGQVSIYNIDWITHKAEFGRLLIGESEAQGKGIAKMASQILLDYAFDTLGLNRFELEVFSSNEPALSIYRFMGFKSVRDENGLYKMVKIFVN